MRIATVVVVALVLGAAGPAGAFLENRAWDCTSAEKVGVSGLGSEKSTVSGITISVDELLVYTLNHPEAGTYFGDITEKGSSKFTGTPTPDSLDDFRSWLEEVAAVDFGVGSPDIESLKWKIAGKVASDGALTVKAKAIAKGTGEINGKRRRGKVTWKSKLTGEEL